MKTVLPKFFKEAFLNTVKANKKDIIFQWQKSYSDFTEKMRSIFPNIAKELKLELYNKDYYTIDAVFYEEEDLRIGQGYVKYITIAFEHENKIVGSEAEINKLQLINTPLKVLVTYPNNSEQKDAYLSKYAEIIEESDIFSDFSTLRKQLVIFGEFADANVNWSFHVYQHGKFISI